MSDAVLTIPGKVIRDLCEALGVEYTSVNRIEITPRSVAVVTEFRKGDRGIQLKGDKSDVLTKVTEIAIRWADDA